MKALVTVTALSLALLLAGCGSDESAGNSAAAGNAPIQAVPAPNGGDWTQTVAETPEGGVRMGNPNAAVKLVEYASITCPHCAEFSEKGGETLRNTYVKSGQVSWEFRPFLLFPTDPGVSMLLKCQGAEPFFRMSEQLYAQQSEWVGRLQALPEAQLQAIQNLPPDQRAAALVQAAGVDAYFRQRGMPEARIKSCLSNQRELEKLAAITTRATNEEGVTGTPTFFINGELVPNTADWATLEPKLRAAIGR